MAKQDEAPKKEQKNASLFYMGAEGSFSFFKQAVKKEKQSLLEQEELDKTPKPEV